MQRRACLKSQGAQIATLEIYQTDAVRARIGSVSFRHHSFPVLSNRGFLTQHSVHYRHPEDRLSRPAADQHSLAPVFDCNTVSQREPEARPLLPPLADKWLIEAGANILRNALTIVQYFQNDV